MKYLPRIVTLLFFLISPMFVYGTDFQIPLGVYEYVYEYNTNDLIENHYIVLSKSDNTFKGRYFGTSDDFDDAREGYLPGFFSEKMDNLVVKGSKISFIIKPFKFFKNPITPLIKDNQNSPWNIGIRFEKRKYYGEYKDGILVIFSEGLDKRIYTKIKQ